MPSDTPIMTLDTARLTPTLFAQHCTRGKYKVPKHIQFTERLVMECVSRRIKRLMVFMPPRHGKSELISKWLPAWLLGTFPDQRVILSSYAASFAAEWGGKVRDILNEHGEEVFGIKLRSQRSNFLTIEGHEGSMQTAGVGGPITGKGADIFIIDDPVKNAEEALSVTYREKAWNWWQSVADTRLEPNAIVIVLLTRWHEGDLAGRILAEQEEAIKDGVDVEPWTVLRLPALAESDDPLGREEGGALWPERWPREALLKKRKSGVNYWFNAMYQQRPVSNDTEIIKSASWRRVARSELPVMKYVYQSWDTAFKTNQRNDYSACTTWGIGVDNNFYLLHAWRDRLEYPDLQRKCIELMHRWKAQRVVIEDKASGQSLIQSLRKLGISLGIMKADADKILRTHEQTDLFDEGRVFIVEGEPWSVDVLEETSLFPYAPHDDLHDTVVHGLKFGRHITSTGTGLPTRQKETTSTRRRGKLASQYS